MDPFLTFITPTFRRPQALARCLASVGGQSAVEAVQQFTIVDHVGVGVDGMYERIPLYKDAVHGQYVHLLADDDVLAGPHVVQQVRERAEREGFPPVLIVGAIKGHLTLPLDNAGPPVCGRIDLGCIVVRRDIWQRHAGDYGKNYEGDFWFAKALWDAGHAFVYARDITFLIGAVSRGAAEVAA
jgi:hypothetical protein